MTVAVMFSAINTSSMVGDRGTIIMVIIKSTNDAPTTSDRFDAKRANELIEPSIWEAPKKDEIKIFTHV
jgi:hypothetical protein